MLLAPAGTVADKWAPVSPVVPLVLPLVLPLLVLPLVFLWRTSIVQNPLGGPE